jgi:hypothetical protein
VGDDTQEEQYGGYMGYLQQITGKKEQVQKKVRIDFPSDRPLFPEATDFRFPVPGVWPYPFILFLERALFSYDKFQ